MLESDEALYQRWIAGDMRAFDAIYARYERPLFGFVRVYVREASDAEDVIHEAFLAVLRERAPAMRSFRAWIFTVTRNLCLNRARSRKRHATEELDEIHDAAPSAEAQLEVAQRAVILERAVSRLPETYAELYRLRATGLSYDEVAEMLNVPLGTVKSRMHEMVARLKSEVMR
jgi:RNA polymerase sigma-70 factor, ECF subfamily